MHKFNKQTFLWLSQTELARACFLSNYITSLVFDGGHCGDVQDKRGNLAVAVARVLRQAKEPVPEFQELPSDSSSMPANLEWAPATFVSPWCGSHGVRCHISVYIHSPAAPARQDSVGREATRQGCQEVVLCRSAARHFCCNAELGRAKRASTCGATCSILNNMTLSSSQGRSYRRRLAQSITVATATFEHNASPNISPSSPAAADAAHLSANREYCQPFSGTVWPVAHL